MDEGRLTVALAEALELLWPLRGRLVTDARAGLRVVDSDAPVDLAVVPPRPALVALTPGVRTAFVSAVRDGVLVRLSGPVVTS